MLIAQPNTETSGLRVVLISLHGLIRFQDPELGKDADTGGQVKYVLELAHALGQHPQVESVELMTRQILDSKISEDYGRCEEVISDKVKIVRIPFGPKRYLKKEKLWPYIDSFIDQAMNYLRRTRKLPNMIHGHYADAGYAGAQMARLLGVPFIFTGHSLGRVKQQTLLAKKSNKEEMETDFKFNDRVEAEEHALDTASFVVTSTFQEIEQQYELYDHYAPDRMEVIPPGVDLVKFTPPDASDAPNTDLIKDIHHFLDEPEKPAILIIARADEKKNFANLIHAYGKSKQLQEQANLIVIAGNRDDIQKLDASARKVLQQILVLIDTYELYGKVAYPKHHRPEEIPMVYRWATLRKGVFVNPAYNEPFGLTLLEASASGLPIVATNDGGPRDILATCKNGLLIDPLNVEDITHAIERVLSDEEQWKTLSENGITNVNENYAWSTHAKKLIRDVVDLNQNSARLRPSSVQDQYRLPNVDRLLVSDIDNTLTGDSDALKELMQKIDETEQHIGFGIATGRSLLEAQEILAELNVRQPDLLIAACGTEVYYRGSSVMDKSWQKKINYRWQPDAIKACLANEPGVILQGTGTQSHFKISYRLEEGIAPKLSVIKRILREQKLSAKVILSSGIFLDIIPIRAGDGLALRHACFRWDLPFSRVMVAGDSGNDIEMLMGDTLGLVVGNYSPELKKLKGRPRIHFAEQHHARGILEGIDYYDFFNHVVIPNDHLV